MDEEDYSKRRATLEQQPPHLFWAAVLDDKLGEPRMRTLLRQLGLMLTRGEQLPIDVAQWLGIALVAIGDGADAELALRLKSRRGRPERVDWKEVLQRYHALYLGGVAHTTACAQIAADMSVDGIEVDEKTIRNAYEKYMRWTYDTFPRHILEAVSEDMVFELVCMVHQGREMFQPLVDAAARRDQDRNK